MSFVFGFIVGILTFVMFSCGYAFYLKKKGLKAHEENQE